MMRVPLSILGCVMVMSAITHAVDRDALAGQSSPEQPHSIILSAAAQDAEVFVTWSSLAAAQYTVRWKPSSTGAWNVLNAGSSSARAVTGLVNGVPHDFQIEARQAGSLVAVSAVISATPRPRPSCVVLDYYPWVPRVSFFCTKAALDAYLQEQAINPLSLRCRQRLVTEWNADSPDCLYAAPSGEQLLLLRSADFVFSGGNQYPNPTDIRLHARRAIWGDNDPFDQPSTATWTTLPQPIVGAVTRHVQAQSFRIAYAGGLSSRITMFTPQVPVAGRYSIYHEGHGGAAVEIGAETIDWLLDRGWHVIAVDMPLIGTNSGDMTPEIHSHGHFDLLDGAVTGPIGYYLSPVQSIVDRIVELNPGHDPDVLMIGRSGGGWTTYAYAAVDPRIDVAVSVAGGRPISERLDAPWGAAELGDYEQTVPYLYNAVAHEHLMIAAGSKGSFHIFNKWDTCCFRVQRDSAFVHYLLGTSTALGKSVGVFVDEENAGHSIGALGYLELERYLGQVSWHVPRVPKPPSNFRIITTGEN
jgi:hypothetical protein